MRSSLSNFACLILLAGCSTFSRPEPDIRLTALARNICIANTFALDVATEEVEDFSIGSVAVASGKRRVHFYVGGHPDFSGMVSEEPLPFRSEAFSRVSAQSYSDGSNSILVEPLVTDEMWRDIVVFRSKEGSLADDPDAMRLVDNVRRCVVQLAP